LAHFKGATQLQKECMFEFQENKTKEEKTKTKTKEADCTAGID
jgi:hypothetical protein